ncbi:MAG: hypothetical protein D6765_14480 [Bacteroidetes bacterium]|nr:MAG: hypothetical protein D6765_14480 [Bacteroidota bacterium]
MKTKLFLFICLLSGSCMPRSYWLGAPDLYHPAPLEEPDSRSDPLPSDWLDDPPYPENAQARNWKIERIPSGSPGAGAGSGYACHERISFWSKHFMGTANRTCQVQVFEMECWEQGQLVYSLVIVYPSSRRCRVPQEH